RKGDDCRQPCWSSDGKWIVYQRQVGKKWSLWLHDVVKGTATAVKIDGDATDATFSSDSKSILYSGDNDAGNGLFLIPVTGGQPRFAAPQRKGYRGAPSMSPDGKWIACESSDRDPDGGPGTHLELVALT